MCLLVPIVTVQPVKDEIFDGLGLRLRKCSRTTIDLATRVCTCALAGGIGFGGNCDDVMIMVTMIILMTPMILRTNTG